MISCIYVLCSGGPGIVSYICAYVYNYRIMLCLRMCARESLFAYVTSQLKRGTSNVHVAVTSLGKRKKPCLTQRNLHSRSVRTYSLHLVALQASRSDWISLSAVLFRWLLPKHQNLTSMMVNCPCSILNNFLATELV